MSTTTAPQTQTVTSADGTRIAYTKAGSGPALILVDGALCHRRFGPSPSLSQRLQDHFTVYTYDRRGRGESGDTQPYSVRREVEDIEALVRAAGGSAYLFGQSSGAALALDAADAIDGVTRLATYEAPFIVDGTHEPRPDFVATLDAFIAKDDRSGALKYFMKTVGAPSIMVTIMSLTPVWKKLKAVAPTLPNDARMLGTHHDGTAPPADRWSRRTVPTLMLDGGKSPEYMRTSQRTIADLLPDTRYETLPGQTHMVKAQALAPKLVEFFQP